MSPQLAQATETPALQVLAELQRVDFPVDEIRAKFRPIFGGGEEVGGDGASDEEVRRRDACHSFHASCGS